MRNATLLLLTILWYTPYIVAQNRDINSTGLYIHTDKHIYTPAEKIWFTGYLLNIRATDTIPYHTLFVALINPITRKPVLNERFAFDRGVAKGLLLLPDSLPPGDYALVGYTNNYIADNHEQEFQQWISVRKPHQPPFKTRKTPADTTRTATLKIPDSNICIRLDTDSTTYRQRGLVNCRVELTDTTGKPIQGLFSVACVCEKRLRKHDKWDICHYYFIDQYRLPASIDLSTAQQELNPVSGFVTKGSKKVKKPIPLLLMKNNEMITLKTNKDGVFCLNSYQLITTPGQPDAILSVVKGNQSEFKINFLNDIERVNHQLAKINYPYTPEDMADSTIFMPEEITAMDVSAQAPPAPKMPVPQQEPGYVKKVKPVYTPPEFQQASDTIATPNFSSTLYWNHLINTDEQGHANFTFRLNDLPGVFVCVIQGISTMGVFSKYLRFVVR
ncbi:hypothetical protein SAMN04488128_103866 [Chitinophaga eiseniae]|uniref:Carboxypeptidase regulatory-like domain-containing protein n=1 Tax=Chitinophaga eiseniae TaxID=634771 RepID=A0A1T4T036_9BACT|nr:hypothetical protein [Chitinophaga eiseniae]SKA33611.1 hypothetical protein SAMN04488128_103866 [Chitinophaga eiseniae]